MNKRLIALDFITACLSVSRSPTLDVALRRTIASGSLDWATVISIVHAEFITPTLWAAVLQRGLTGFVPRYVLEYLGKVHLLAIVRNRQFKDQAIALIRELNAIGVQPTILKGGASLFVTPYSDPGCRLMADLDILVPAERADECWESVRRCGYVPNELEFDYSVHHHLRPLRNQSGNVTVEIHRSPLAAPAGGLVSDEFIAEHLQPIVESGVRLTVPDSTLRILNILLHSGVVDREYARGSMCLRALHEIALIQSKYPADVDCVSISEIMERAGKRKLLEAWLYCAHRMFDSPLPGHGSATLRTVIHYHRMRLQAGVPILAELVDEAMSFSRRDICDRYKCRDDFLSLTVGRMRLAASLARQHSRNVANRVLRPRRNHSARTCAS